MDTVTVAQFEKNLTNKKNKQVNPIVDFFKLVKHPKGKVTIFEISTNIIILSFKYSG